MKIPVLLLCAGLLRAQPVFHIPAKVVQGELLRIETTAPGKLRAKLGGRVVLLYPSGEGSAGLLPAAVDDKPGPHEVSILDAAGNAIHSATVEVINAHYRIQNIETTMSMKALTPLPGEMEAMKALAQLQSPLKLWSEPLLPPVPDCRNSSFGVARYHNGKPSGNFHRGLDLLSPLGRPVKAPAAGKVIVAQKFRMHGGTVGIDHGQGVTSHYLHLSRLASEEGQEVKAGDVVGYVGATGFATGPHLHWGVYVHGVPVNPERLAKGIALCGVPPARPVSRVKAKAKQQ